MKLYPLICVASLFAFNAALAGEYQFNTPVKQTVYEGTLGNKKIVLQTLDAKQNGKTFRAASYFYASQRLEIPLTKKDNGFEEYSSNCYIDEKCKLVAKLSLTNVGNGLKGKWVAASGDKSYEVSLKPVATATFTQHYEISDNDGILSDTMDGASDLAKNMFKRKMALGETTYSKEQFMNGYGYKTATDKLSGIHYIILTSAPKGQNLGPINKTLTDIRLSMVGYGLECKAMPAGDSPAYGTFGDWDSYTSEPVNINDRILVTEESGSTFCGGAHPNNSYLHAIFDMKTGNLIYHYDLFKLYYEQDYNKLQTIAFKKIFKKITSDKKYLIREASDDADFDKECIYGGQENTDDLNDNTDYSWMPFSAYPAKDGVVFALENVPHVAGGCMGDYYKISYKEALPLMTPLAKQLFAKELAGK